MGATGLIGQEGWYYPDYVAEKCPGLPSWTALKGCAEIFATAGSPDKRALLESMGLAVDASQALLVRVAPALVDVAVSEKQPVALVRLFVEDTGSRAEVAAIVLANIQQAVLR